MNKEKGNQWLLIIGGIFALGACFLSGTSIGDGSQGLLYLTIIIAVIFNFSTIKKANSDINYEVDAEFDEIEEQRKLEKEKLKEEAKERIRLKRIKEEEMNKEIEEQERLRQERVDKIREDIRETVKQQK